MQRRLNRLLLLLIGMLVLSSVHANGRPTEMRVHIRQASEKDLVRLKALGIVVDRRHFPDVYLNVIPAEYEMLIEAGFHPKVLIPNMLSYVERLRKSEALSDYYSFAEAQAMTDSLVARYPAIIRKVILGYSLEQRPLFALKISDQVQLDEAEPELAFDGCHHGDEIISGEMLLRLARTLCESYRNDALITRLIDTREIWILPFANPDGRAYLHRRNLNRVDINRDWGYMWDGWGDSETPFSQPETRALMQWVLNHQFVIAQSIHAGMEAISFPWSYRPNLSPDHAVIEELASGYVRASDLTSIRFGNGYEELYPVNGTAKDSYYGVRGSLGWTMEVSKEKAPAGEQVREIYQRHLPAMLHLISAAGKGLHGRVSSAHSDAGVAAIIWVNDDQGEYWPVYSDPKVGDYHKLLHPGYYSLMVTANGYQSVFLPEVRVPDSGLLSLDIQLEETSGDFAYQVISCQIPGNNFSDNGLTYRALGMPDRRCYSLGKDGWIVLDMGAQMIDVPGNDVYIYEGDHSSESFSVSISQSWNGPWKVLGQGRGTTAFDIAAAGEVSFRYVRIQDDGSSYGGIANAGFDLDAVEVPENSGDLTFLSADNPAIVDTPGIVFGIISEGENAALDLGLTQPEQPSVGDVEILNRVQPQILYPDFLHDRQQHIPSEGKTMANLLFGSGSAPESFALMQNFPNPFNPRTTITFHLATFAPVLLTIYDMLGRKIDRLVAEALPAGAYSVAWEGRTKYGQSLPSGIYFFELRAADFFKIRKMVLIH